MRLIEASLILIPPSRQRQSFDETTLVELSNSISQVGLINPITVRASSEGPVLVAGERRIRAIKDLWAMGSTFLFEGTACPEGWLPCVEAGELGELEAEETEFAENRDRADLSWQEQAGATARLESLRIKQADGAGVARPTPASLADELHGRSDGAYQESVRQDLIVARHLSDPDVASAPSKKEAFKVLKHKELRRRNTELAATFGATYTAASHTLLQTDALDWLKVALADTYDVILTDPPYGMGADEFGDAGGRTQGEHGYQDDEVFFKDIMKVFIPESFRVTKPLAHLYCFCDIDWFHFLREGFTSAGWWVHRTPIIWHKPTNPRLPWSEHGPQRKWEMILYAVKGKRPVNKIAPDLVAWASDPNLGHAAQKPVALFEDFLKRSVRPGDSVLDPFCGSGPIFEAAHRVKCKATGLERDPASYAIAAQRIERLKDQLEMPI